MDGFMFGSCCLYPEDNESNAHGSTGTTSQDKIDNNIPTTLASFENKDEDNKWTSLNKQSGAPASDTTISTTSRKTTTAIPTKSTVTYVKPTRPTRPSKPGVRWPPSSSDFHLLKQSLSNSENSNKKTTSPHHHHTVEILRPTKTPPSKPYNKYGSTPYSTSTTKSTLSTQDTSWVWTKVSANSDETLELPHKNIPHIYQEKPLKQKNPIFQPNRYFPSSGTTSSESLFENIDKSNTNRRPLRPTRPARPPKPSQIITYFPGGSVKQTPASIFVINAPGSSRNTTTKFTFVTTPRVTTTTTSTIFPIIIRRTTKTPPTKRATTAKTTLRPSTFPLSVLHTVPSPGDLSTTTASTARPASAPPLSASSRSGGCGLPQIKKFCPKGRIVNGTQSCYGQFPWQVILGTRSYMLTCNFINLN